MDGADPVAVHRGISGLSAHAVRTADGRPVRVGEATKDQEASKLGLYHSRLTVWLGEARLRADQPEAAIAHAERTLALSRERGERGVEGYASWLLGEVASSREPLDVEIAEGQYRQALVLANERGMRPLVAHCHAGLARLYRRTGKSLLAEEHLASATTLYREMQMKSWMETAKPQ